MKYLTNCVQCRDLEALDEMMEKEREIKYQTFTREVNKEEIEALFPCYNDLGFDISQDWAVRFFSSKFNGKKCYFIRHSAIEYIFQEKKVSYNLLSNQQFKNSYSHNIEA